MTAVTLNDVTMRRDGLTLEISRDIAAPRALVWRCWTEAGLLKEWFCPKPWHVPEADLDPRPGGRFNTVMAGPDGERFENVGMFLEVEPGRRLVFTDAYSEGYQPRPNSFMTGYVELSDLPDGGTRLVWGARHPGEAERDKHLEMGFEEGWSAASAQLAELAVAVSKDPVALRETPRLASRLRTCLFFKDRGEEAMNYYVSLLPGSSVEMVYRPEPDQPALVAEFTLAGAPYMILNGNPDETTSHFASISVLTEDQEETDRLWADLLADGGEEGHCGWLKDRFGMHWQIVPKALPRLMCSGDARSCASVREALLTMKKIDIAGLEAAA